MDTISAPTDTISVICKLQQLLPDQDHHNTKSRTNAMLGSIRFRTAASTFAGIEVIHRILTKPFGGGLRLKETTAPAA